MNKLSGNPPFKPFPKEVTNKRRDEIARLANEVGLNNLPTLYSLADKYGVSYVTIHKDIKAIINRLDPDKVKKIVYDIDVKYRKTLKTAEELMQSESEMARAEGAKIFFKYVESVTKFLENYEFKNKVAEKVEVRQETVDWKDVAEYHEKLKKKYAKKQKSTT